MAKVITAFFTTQSKALRAMEDLVAHDYAQEDISLLMPETTQGRHFAITESSKAPEGIALGAIVCGVLCAVLFGLTSVGLITAPGAAISLSGQFVSALMGFGCGALLGGLIGGLIGVTMTEHEVKFCGAAPKERNILLGVISGSDVRTDEALKLIQSNDATHIHTDDVKTENIKQAEAA